MLTSSVVPAQVVLGKLLTARFTHLMALKRHAHICAWAVAAFVLALAAPAEPAGAYTQSTGCYNFVATNWWRGDRVAQLTSDLHPGDSDPFLVNGHLSYHRSRVWITGTPYDNVKTLTIPT